MRRCKNIHIEVQVYFLFNETFGLIPQSMIYKITKYIRTEKITEFQGGTVTQNYCFKKIKYFFSKKKTN